MIRELLLLAGSLALFAAPVTAQCRFEDEVVFGANPNSFLGPAKFGSDVCIWGDIGIVGAPQSAGSDDAPSGYARAHRRQRPGWVVDEIFGPTNVEAGTAVDFDGKHLAVGAPGVTSGHVRLFAPSANEWLNVDILLGVAGFGSNVAIQDDWLAVQSPFGFGGARIDLYQLLSDGSWVLSDFVEGPTTGSGKALFGQGLAVGRGWLFVGNPDKGTGAVEAYRLRGTEWIFSQTLTSSSPMACDFGWDLALHRGRLIVSERCTDTVRFFQLENELWTETDSVALPTTGTSPSTDLRVDLTDHWAVVGVNELGEPGRAWLLRKRLAGWTLDTELCNSKPDPGFNNRSFGGSVSISQSHVLVGHDRFEGDGGAFFYSLNGATSQPGVSAPLVK